MSGDVCARVHPCAQAQVLKQHLGGMHQRLEHLDQQMQEMRSEQERAEREREQQLEDERLKQAGQTMVALGVDLSDPKHNPGGSAQAREQVRGLGARGRGSGRAAVQGGGR